MTRYVVNQTAYVANDEVNTVTPIRTATNKAGKPITVGSQPTVIAIARDGTTAYVINGNAATPIRTATNTAGKAIRVGAGPAAIAIVRRCPGRYSPANSRPQLITSVGRSRMIGPAGWPAGPPASVAGVLESTVRSYIRRNGNRWHSGAV